MKHISSEEFYGLYQIHSDLTPEKSYKTQVAFMNRPEMMPPVILKEMDEKRAHIYQALTAMWNPYIASVYEVYHVLPKNSEKYIAVTENVGETSLRDYVRTNGPLPVSTAVSICIQLCEGLSEFHKKGYIHRDLKPDNLMMTSLEPKDLKIKIIDFGGAKKIETHKNSDTTVIGTLGYQAPESLSAATRNTADIFSIGCILNFLLTGQEPGVQRYTEKNRIVSIIEKATHVDPSSRYPSVDSLKKHLLREQQFFKLHKIPILRSTPGFRTHTCWKMLVASLTYFFVAYLVAIQLLQELYAASIEMLFFYFLVPLVMICNLGNLLRFVPFSIRSSSQKFFLLRLLCVVCSFLIPLIIQIYFP